jgi:hypothetical protein
MAQQGKQMRVGARKGFAYHSVKLALLANGNRYEVDFNMFFPSGKALCPSKILLCPNSPFVTNDCNSFRSLEPLKQKNNSTDFCAVMANYKCLLTCLSSANVL